MCGVVFRQNFEKYQQKFLREKTVGEFSLTERLIQILLKIFHLADPLVLLSGDGGFTISVFSSTITSFSPELDPAGPDRIRIWMKGRLLEALRSRFETRLE